MRDSMLILLLADTFHLTRQLNLDPAVALDWGAFWSYDLNFDIRNGIRSRQEFPACCVRFPI